MRRRHIRALVDRGRLRQRRRCNHRRGPSVRSDQPLRPVEEADRGFIAVVWQRLRPEVGCIALLQRGGGVARRRRR